MKKTSTVQLVRNATLKIRYAGHTMLIDPVLADKGTLISALGVNKNTEGTPHHSYSGYYRRRGHGAPDPQSHRPLRAECPHTFAQRNSFLRSAPGRGRHQKRRIYKCDTHRRNKNNRRHIHLPHDRTSWFRADRADDGTCIRLCAKAEGFPTVYIMGDCRWEACIRDTVERFNPDYIVVNSGGAIFPEFSKTDGPIIPTRTK